MTWTRRRWSGRTGGRCSVCSVLAGHVGSGSCTRPCTASAGRSCRSSWNRPASRLAGWWPPRLAPDPDFPTAPFPEPGGAGRARPGPGRRRAAWRRTSCSPTTLTRTAWPSPSPDAGPRGLAGFRVLSGDELGVLIADHLISATTGAGPAGGDHGGLLFDALGPGRRGRGRLRRDVDRLQVDRPGRPAAARSPPPVRLRGGARLRRQRRRGRQGRPVGGARSGRHGGQGEARGALAPRPAGRARVPAGRPRHGPMVAAPGGQRRSSTVLAALMAQLAGGTAGAAGRPPGDRGA